MTQDAQTSEQRRWPHYHTGWGEPDNVRFVLAGKDGTQLHDRMGTPRVRYYLSTRREAENLRDLLNATRPAPALEAVRLLRELGQYAKHSPGCADAFGQEPDECNCGLAETMARIAEYVANPAAAEARLLEKAALEQAREAMKAAHEWFAMNHTYAPSDPQEGEYYEPCEPGDTSCEACNGLLHDLAAALDAVKEQSHE